MTTMVSTETSQLERLHARSLSSRSNERLVSAEVSITQSNLRALGTCKGGIYGGIWVYLRLLQEGPRGLGSFEL